MIVLAFADAAVQLYQDQGLWQQSQHQAGLILKQVFCREDAASSLIDRLYEASDQQSETARRILPAVCCATTY